MWIWIVGAFALSMSLGYLFTQLAQRRSRPIAFQPGRKIRLACEQGVFSVRIDSQKNRVLWLDAPLQANSHVPLRVGTKVYLEIPMETGVAKFRTEVTERESQSHTLKVEIPADVLREERRTEERHYFPDGLVTRLNSRPAIVNNLSSGGACILSREEVSAGDWVILDLPDEPERYACVLESRPDALDGRLASKIRVVFADPR